MKQVTEILNAIHAGDAGAADQLLPLVYEELRKLARSRLAREAPDQTMSPTALVHEVYLRLVDVEQRQVWESRGHFFAAAAEAMRRILVENARRRQSLKRGGGHLRHELDETRIAAPDVNVDILILDEALNRLEAADRQAAELVKLRYFSGLTIPEAAEILGVSTRTAERLWTFAKAWLYREICSE